MTGESGRSLDIWRLRMERQRYESVLVLALKGRIGGASSRSLHDALDEIIGQGHTRVVVDLTEVDYVSSAGLLVLDGAGGRLTAAGGRLVLCGMGDAVRIAFDLAALASPRLVERDRDAAIRNASTIWPEPSLAHDRP
jgi:anti-anti-sigma factor